MSSEVKKSLDVRQLLLVANVASGYIRNDNALDRALGDVSELGGHLAIAFEVVALQRWTDKTMSVCEFISHGSVSATYLSAASSKVNLGLQVQGTLAGNSTGIETVDRSLMRLGRIGKVGNVQEELDQLLGICGDKSFRRFVIREAISNHLFDLLSDELLK